MSSFAYQQQPTETAHLVLAAGLGLVGCFLLLPRPRGRSVAGGIAALLIAAAIAGIWINNTFGEPGVNWVERALFILFSCGAIVFGIGLVCQRNPARGAISFAFVILSTCGLFLLLAAPFLMAATIIIYAGAIVVTFLFVLMLSAASGPSDENDRSREPLLGSLAGFAFTGLILFTLSQSHGGPAPLPAPLLTLEEKQSLRKAAEEMKPLEEAKFYSASTGQSREERTVLINKIEQTLDETVGLHSAMIEGSISYGSIQSRLAGRRADYDADSVLKQVEGIRKDGARAFRKIEEAIDEPNRVKPEDAASLARKLREQVRLLAGAGELPARNTAGLGYLLYSEHLLDIELAGTLLLVATIGAIAIAHRKPKAVKA